jgi:arylsulfatase A-like enzyme
MSIRDAGAARRSSCLVLIVFLCLSCGGDSEPAVRIVLITVDTLRYDSFAGGDDQPSSMMVTQAIAKGGLVFTHSYSTTSTTQPTHATMFTGLHPWQHGVTRNGMVLSDSSSTLAEQMQEVGFETAAVVASFPLGRKFGFQQGFGRYDDEFTTRHVPNWEGVDVPGTRFYSFADEITAKALKHLDRARGSRQFYWFHYFDPHEPYGDTEDLDGEKRKKRPIRLFYLIDHVKRNPTKAKARIARAHRYYTKDVRSLDRALEPLFRRLLDDAEEIETHIIVTADHGESFGESGAFGHSNRLTEEQIHVPLFIISPRVSPATRQVPAGSIDIHATISSLAGLAGGASGGRDLTQEVIENRMVVGMRQTFAKPVEEIHADGEHPILDRHQFYAATDMRVYKGDRSGISANDSELVEDDIAIQIGKMFESFELQLEGSKAEELIDSETQKKLEALGYVR